ncbi:MAG: hypothetical protein WDW38_005053 [Sanguina aurantia]
MTSSSTRHSWVYFSSRRPDAGALPSTSLRATRITRSASHTAHPGGVHRQHAGLPHQRPKQLAFSNARGVRHSHQRRSDQELSGFLQDLPSQASDLEQRAERAIQHLQLQLKAARLHTAAA